MFSLCSSYDTATEMRASAVRDGWRGGHEAIWETPEFSGVTSPPFSTLWIHPPSAYVEGNLHFGGYLTYKNIQMFASELKTVLEFSWGERLPHFLSTPSTISMLFRIATLWFASIYEFPGSWSNLASLEVSYQFPVSSKSFLPWISLMCCFFF